MSMNIRKHLGTPVLLAALVLGTGIPGMAGSSHSRKVILFHPAMMGGTTLPAGKYSVRWKTHSPQASVKFVQRHQTLLATEGIVEQRDTTYSHNEVLYSTTSDGAMSLLEIRFAGSNKALVFTQ